MQNSDEIEEKTALLADLLQYNPNKSRRKTQAFIIDDTVIQQVELMAGLGLSLMEMSEMLGMNHNTLLRKRKKHEELEGAIRRGRLVAQTMISSALFNKALSGDTSAMQFYLKNRAPEKWADKRSIDHTNSDGTLSAPTEVLIQAREVTTENKKLTRLEDATE